MLQGRHNPVAIKTMKEVAKPIVTVTDIEAYFEGSSVNHIEASENGTTTIVFSNFRTG